MTTKEEQRNVMRCCPNINKDIVLEKVSNPLDTKIISSPCQNNLNKNRNGSFYRIK